MAEFLYKAQNSQGNSFEGTLEAKDKAEAEALLLRRRLVITSLKKKPTEIKIKIGSGIKTEDITRFTRMFSSMCSAGLPMLQCLNILEAQCENPELKNVVHKLTQSINGGSSLADALAQHPKVFDSLYRISFGKQRSRRVFADREPGSENQYDPEYLPDHRGARRICVLSCQRVFREKQVILSETMPQK